ncbi:hypothetical protein IE969_19670 [Klebsiella pneumoniae]|nr:hypothetical protein [Klebsiella pneumoniae]
MMMKAWASGHGKAAINAVMIDCLFTGQCHPCKPASLADNLREWHEKFLRQNTTLSRLDSIHCKTTTVIKPYCKKAPVIIALSVIEHITPYFNG